MQTPNSIIISGDSHTMEPPDLWATRVDTRFRDRAPRFPEHKVGEGFQHHPGGHNPHARLKEMAQDGVSAEVLYPTLGLGLYSQQDADLQEACFRAYNDWAIEYCRVAPDRLIGVPMISCYNIDHAVQELERCARAGLKGSLIWQSPHPDLPFRSEHYDPFWAASQDLDMPVNLHILTGHGYFNNPKLKRGPDHYRGSVNLKLLDAMDAVYDFIFYGILERYPRLKVVVVENEVGWLPFTLQQWDYYYKRFREQDPVPMAMLPSEYFRRQVYATFFNDTVGGHAFEWWDGVDNCMWSNDFPHPNSTWPNSRQVIQRDLGHLPREKLSKLVCENVVNLYGIRMPELAEPAL